MEKMARVQDYVINIITFDNEGSTQLVIYWNSQIPQQMMSDHKCLFFFIIIVLIYVLVCSVK